MIGQSAININSGGRSRISGISAALFLLTFILVGSSLIEMIPVAALVGVMFIVVIGTLNGRVYLVGKIQRLILVGLSVMVVTVLTGFSDCGYQA